MAFKAGQEKSGGRQKGTPNKIKSELKDSINKIVTDNIDKLQDDLESLEPKDRISLILKFVEYVIPKEREQKIDFSSLSDTEIDELINRITNEADRKN
jgi:hypothetical protein